MANNDMIIIYTIVSFFFIAGFVVGAINTEYGDGGTAPNIENFQDDFTQTAGEEIDSSLSIWKIIGSIASMFFWTFGAIPAWLDLLIWIPRLILYVTLARNIWVGGGG